MRRKQNPIFRRIYKNGVSESGSKKGFNIDSEEFQDLRYQIIEKSIIIKSSNCGALALDFENVFRFVNELLDVIEVHGELPQ